MGGEAAVALESREIEHERGESWREGDVGGAPSQQFRNKCTLLLNSESGGSV